MPTIVSQSKFSFTMETNNCIEKMMNYANPRGITVNQATLGLYKVTKSGKTHIHEAVKAVAQDGTKGWIINMGRNDRQRKFYPDNEVKVYPYQGASGVLKKPERPFRRCRFSPFSDAED